MCSFVHHNPQDGLSLPAPDVDVLQVDAASVTSSVEERHHQQDNGQRGSLSNPAEEEGEGTTAKQETERSGCDDLRNYAYEGGGSSPGSLSSCEYIHTIIFTNSKGEIL